MTPHSCTGAPPGDTGRSWPHRRDITAMTGRRQARRENIVLAARQVFERLGYFDARVADIVEQAAVAPGTFYAYFDSKEAIFHELAQTVLASMVASMHGESTEEATPYQRIETAMRRFVDAYRPNARIIGLCEQVGSVSPTMRDLRLAMRDAFVSRSERGIIRQQSAGIADPDVDPRVTAEVLGAMVDHTCYVWLNLGRAFDEEEVIRTMTTVWARALKIAEVPAVDPAARSDGSG